MSQITKDIIGISFKTQKADRTLLQTNDQSQEQIKSGMINRF